MAAERRMNLRFFCKNPFLLIAVPILTIFIMSFLPWREARSLPVSQSVSVSATTSATIPIALPAIPINPSASEEASELLNHLANLSGKGIMAGQHDYLESPDELNNKLKNTSGEHAVLHGYELGAITNQSKDTIASQRQAVVNSAIRWSRDGGIVAMTFHQSLPGTSPKWSNVSMKLSQEEFDTYVTPGTPQYQSLITDLDEIAVYLGELRDAGVPVLWRPYHEMNGNWFWWGGKDNFTVLWNLMYDRLVNTHKLNNLLWVWNANAPNQWSDPYTTYYPGADKVDLLALDIYNNDYKQSYYEGLLEFAAGKPIGIGEIGELPNADMLSEAQNQWVYTMIWGKMLTENNNLQQIKDFMSHDHTVTREDYILTIAATSNKGAKVSQHGLTGEYFNNAELFGQPVIIRNDSKVDFNWQGESPAAGIERDGFSVRWKGKVKPVYSEKYTFLVSSDDGVRVWIDGKLLIDDWRDHSAAISKGSIELTAGILYDIKLEYYENRGDASVRLMWESPRQRQAVIPQNALFFP